jgi:copper chaperone CopZ
MFSRSARTFYSRFRATPSRAAAAAFAITHPEDKKSMTAFKVNLWQDISNIQSEYAVSMECQSCVDSVSKVLSETPGVNEFKVSLENQSVLVIGSVAPSKITRALRETGRAAILRGSGDSDDGLGFTVLES